MLQLHEKCLGRKAVVHDSRTLQFARYLTPSLPPPPSQRYWAEGQTKWGMMLNDKLGDCTIAGCGHAIQVWGHALQKEHTVTDAQILSKYELWDGYKPSDPNTDQGGIELDVLTKWKNSAFYGHKLDGFAAVNVKNAHEVQQAINLFGGLYIGISLPATAQNQVIWDVTDPSLQGNAAPGSWGGHCVYVTGYDNTGIYCITWGENLKMTLAFWNAYVDEAYALLGQDFINSKGVSASGFNLSQLKADLSMIK
jgi:hypothetical protein